MSRRSPIVVVGTDTGVGKTVVGAGLARAWSDAGLRVAAVKPLESGCDGSATEDGVLLARAARQPAPSEALYRFEAALAAPQAAALEGVALDFAAVVDATRAAIADADIALVETAGGLLSPFTAETTALDLIAALDARVVLVTADRLGTQNHTRLTLRALPSVAAVVLSSAGAEDASVGRNADVLRADCPRLTTLSAVDGVAAAANALRPLATHLAG